MSVLLIGVWPFYRAVNPIGIFTYVKFIADQSVSSPERILCRGVNPKQILEQTRVRFSPDCLPPYPRPFTA